jgi:hypothetical protein
MLILNERHDNAAMEQRKIILGSGQDHIRTSVIFTDDHYMNYKPEIPETIPKLETEKVRFQRFFIVSEFQMIEVPLINHQFICEILIIFIFI